MLALTRLFRGVLDASRKKVFKSFFEHLKPQIDDVILDLGAAGDYYGEQPFFEDCYKHKHNIIGVNININELTSLKRKYTEVPLVLADGCYLPFKSKSIDILFSNAVIEHVGDINSQKKFADEIMRVAKKWFVTTPNFWFPIETHWKLPFIHFLPRGLQKQIMDSGKKRFVRNPPKLPGLIQRPLTIYFSNHGWHGHGYHLLSTRKLKKLFPTSKIKKQRTTFYPEVLIAYFPGKHETRKKILMVGPLPPTVGGIATHIAGILESDLNKKYELITFGTERPTFGIVRDVNDYSLMFRIGLTRLAKSVMSTISHLLIFPFGVIVNRPNLIHIHTSTYWSFWENAIYILISKLLLKRTLIHIHGGLFDKFYESSNSFVKFLIRKNLSLSDKIIVLSLKWKFFFADLVPENKIVVLPNFVVFPRYARFKGERADFPGHVINVLFIGGVGAKTKGVYDVFKAIPMVVRQHENICFVFVACADIDKLDIVSKTQEIISHTKFLDYVYLDNKIKVFSNSDIFILPSHSEGLPITMLEAMATGLPVIATSVGAIPEVIEDGKNGFLIKTGDSHALAEKILILAKDKKLRKKMGKNNIEKIKKQYDREVVIEKLNNEYEKLLLEN